MLIVEDGTGLPNADSLTSLAFADEYHLARGNEAWGAIINERKEQLLRKATDFTTYIIGPSFAGVRAVVGQSLPFPRYSVTDINLYSLGVPIAIQEAVAELALIANTTPLLPTSTAVRKKRVKVGPIEVEYDTASFNGPRFVAATARFAAFMDYRSSGMTARLVRT